MDDGFQYLYPRKQHGTDSICWIWTVTRTPRLPLVLYKQKSNMQSHPHTWKQALPNPSLFFFTVCHIFNILIKLPLNEASSINFQEDPQVRQWPDLRPSMRESEKLLCFHLEHLWFYFYFALHHTWHHSFEYFVIHVDLSWMSWKVKRGRLPLLYKRLCMEQFSFTSLRSNQPYKIN